MDTTGQVGTTTARTETSAGVHSQQTYQAEELQKKLRDDGFVVIRNLLSVEQIKTLRKSVTGHLKSAGLYQYGGKFQLHAMYVAEDIARLLTSEVILDRLKEITRPLDVVLTGECDMMINTTSTWHNDVPHHSRGVDGSLFSDPNFRVYKIAFYLQDQNEASPSALKVKPRSHLKGLRQSMPEKSLAVRAGDAIVFDVRIEHCGLMPTFVDRSLRKIFERIGSRIGLDPQKAFTAARSLIRVVRGAPDRVALFMTFGPSDEQTSCYAEEGRKRHPGVQGTLSADVLKHLAGQNIVPPLIGAPVVSH